MKLNKLFIDFINNIQEKRKQLKVKFINLFV
jgi:hypothetical protein